MPSRLRILHFFLGAGIGTTVSLVAFIALQQERVTLLQGRVNTLEQLVAIQDRWCLGLQDVNDVCEASFHEVAQRLGLDTRWEPLVNTALWRRAAKSKTIAQARRELGASAWQKHAPLDWAAQ